MSPLRVTAAAAALICLSGCVMKTRHRYVRMQPSCFDGTSDPVPGAIGESRDHPSLDCRTVRYKVGFIEFDEDGRPVDPDQEKKVLALIEHEKQRAGGKVITVVYVHGWKNNAGQARPGASPKDAERFRTALAELGSRVPGGLAGKPDVPVVGVYIGWRGKSLMGPGAFTFLSYWGRRNSANRVGGGSVGETLNHVIDRTNENSPSSRVLLVGHSFGARVLEHAVERGGVRLYDPLPESGIVTPRVDLVLYVNSANDARLSMARVQALRADPVTVRHPDYDAAECASPAPALNPICRPYPLMVAITSRGDLATKYLLPIANTIRLDTGSAPMPPPPSGSYSDPIPGAGKYRKAAAAHLRFLQSHDVREVTCPEKPGDPPQCDGSDPGCVFAFRTLGDCITCYRVHERPAPPAAPPFNQTAFWIMGVDKTVVEDHGDIWNLSLVNMIGELMAPRGFFDPASGRARIQKIQAQPGHHERH